jgi:hypothetical protein
MLAETQVGPKIAADGPFLPLRSSKDASLVVQDSHAHFLEANYRGTIFSDGMGLTAINAATYTSATLGATCTPIAGVWNPANSPVNLVILQAILGVTMTALQATGGAPFVWASSIGNAALTLGNAPLSRKTGAQQGSQAKGLANVALTGLTNSLVVRGASALGGGSALALAFLQTAVGVLPQEAANLDNIDGAIIVPPGGVLALLATTTPVAHSAASSLVWEEVPV